jgi:uncharacterized protein (TIRG00374 family)
MSKRWQTAFRWFVSIASLALLVWALRGMKLDQVWTQLKTAVYYWLIPAILVYFVGVWARTWRWYYLLRPIKKIPLLTLFPIVCIGYMGNNIYPARAGELLRAYLLKRREEVAFSTSVATIIVERLFDGIVVLGFVFLTLPMLTSLVADPQQLGNIEKLTVIVAVIFALFLVLFFLMAIFPRKAEKVTVWLVDHLLPKKWRPAVEDFLLRFLTGFESLRSVFEVFMVFLISIFIWLIETCTYYFVARAFGLGLSFYALMMLNGVLNLVTMIPAAPGYIGTFDAVGIELLGTFGIPADVATGFILVLHVTLWLPITLLGAIFFAREGLEWDKALKEAQKTQKMDLAKK